MDQEALKQLAAFIKQHRKQLGLTQLELAERTGLGLRFVRGVEQARPLGYRFDKLNQLLGFFGHTLGPIPLTSRPEYAER